MLTWFQQNLPTILIIAALALFFGWLLYTLVRDKKKGKSSCCGGCAGCAMAGKCHPSATDTAVTVPERSNPPTSDGT